MGYWNNHYYKNCTHFSVKYRIHNCNIILIVLLNITILIHDLEPHIATSQTCKSCQGFPYIMYDIKE